MIGGAFVPTIAVLSAMIAFAPRDDPPAKPADPIAEAAKADLKRFQGTWKVVAFTHAGKELAAEEFPKTVLTIDGDQWTQKLNGKIVNTCTLVLRPIAKPAEMELINNAGRRQGKVFEAIYNLEGETLTICSNRRGERPKVFTAGEGKEASLVVYKRQKPVKKNP